MTRIQVMTEYARLLRWFYCNPSDREVAGKIVRFEREHQALLEPLWIKWQKEPV